MYNLPPLGLINLATTLKNSAHTVKILDLVLAVRRGTLKSGSKIYDDCAEMIAEHAPDLVGFSAQCTTYPSVINIAKKIKIIQPQVKIVIGGHNASFVDIETLTRYPWIDAIVRGEGEETFPELVETLDSGGGWEGVEGVSFRRGQTAFRNKDRQFAANLDTIPLPEYGYVEPLSVYRDACGLPRAIAILEAGRGCPHNCVYCSESILWGRKPRVFSVERLIAEMRRMRDDFSAECFVLAYDQFTAKRDFVESFCRQVIQEGLSFIPWYCISRLDTVDPPLLRLMKEAGCESMCYGIDSGSKRTLKFIRKRIDEDVLYKRVYETTEEGLIPTLSFVIGFPEEERKDIDSTLFMALRTGIIGNNNTLIQMPTVLPGTDLHRRYARDLVRRVDTYFALGLEFDSGKRLDEDEALINSDPVVFSSFFNVPCKGLPLDELYLLAGYFPLMVQLFPRSFLLLSLEREVSVSRLFIEWLFWLKRRKRRSELILTPQDCYNHFVEFAELSRNKSGIRRLDHLAAVLKYEQLCLEAAKSPRVRNSYSNDVKHIDMTTKPLKSAGSIAEKFDFDLHVIILDLKAGKWFQKYNPSPTGMLFVQFGDQLETARVELAIIEFLSLCDGKNTLGEIALMLQEPGGEGNKSVGTGESFCIEAFRELLEAGYLEIDNPEP